MNDPKRWVPDRWDENGHPWRELVGTPHPLPTRPDLLPEVTLDDLAEWERRAPGMDWTFAYTMPTMPHNYVVRGKTISTRWYYKLYALIVAFGEDDTWRGKKRVYLYDRTAERRWWAMSDYPVKSRVINMSEGEWARREYRG